MLGGIVIIVRIYRRIIIIILRSGDIFPKGGMRIADVPISVTV